MEFLQMEMDYGMSYESNESPLVPDDSTNSLNAISNESNWGYEALSYNRRSNQPSELGNSLSDTTIRTFHTTKYEVLDPKYKVYSSSTFRVGRVFQVLWSEPTGNESTSEIRKSKYDKMLPGVRRSVVLNIDMGGSTCL